MGISDWSLDVCASDLGVRGAGVSAFADESATAPGESSATTGLMTVALAASASVVIRGVAGCAAGASPGLRGTSTCSVCPRAFAMRPPSKAGLIRSEEHTSELQSLMRISYAVFCLKKKKQKDEDMIMK